MRIAPFLLLLLLLPTAYSYVPMLRQGDIPVKYYSEELKNLFYTEKCNRTMHLFDAKYYQGIKVVRFVDSGTSYKGLYHPGGIIDLFNHCNNETIAHELAHHAQWKSNVPFSVMYLHEEGFQIIMAEITNTTLIINSSTRRNYAGRRL